MKDNAMLYSLLAENTKLPYAIDLLNEVKYKNCDNLPFIYWPDGVPCIEANAWMASLLINKKYSRKNRGGTFAEYTKNISPFLRFCHGYTTKSPYSNQAVKGLPFTEVTDNSFTLFINGLQARDPVTGKRLRSDNEIIKIGRRCIDFLFFLSSFHNHNSMIGEQHCNITVEKSTFEIKNGKKKPITKTYWKHSSFPSADPVRRRTPISEDVVVKLKAAANQITDRELRTRKNLMIAAFEQTGARRIEIANLKVGDIDEAILSKGAAPLLRLMTAKQKDGKEKVRYLPVERAFLDLADSYIRIRRRVIHRKRAAANKQNKEFEDHDYLLVSHTTGKPISINSLTTELSNLCVSAGIDDEPGHPHLFRHAFITKRIKSLILNHEIANKDDFRRALLNVEAFKLELQQWTDHKSIESLNTYIDLAFNELSNMNDVYDAISLANSVDLTLDRLESFKSDLNDETTELSALLNDLEKIVSAFQEDIKRCGKRIKLNNDNFAEV